MLEHFRSLQTVRKWDKDFKWDNSENETEIRWGN